MEYFISNSGHRKLCDSGKSCLGRSKKTAVCTQMLHPVYARNSSDILYKYPWYCRAEDDSWRCNILVAAIQNIACQLTPAQSPAECHNGKLIGNAALGANDRFQLSHWDNQIFRVREWNVLIRMFIKIKSSSCRRIRWRFCKQNTKTWQVILLPCFSILG